MAAPFFGPVKATVSGTPGTGAITPSTASSGYLAFSVIPPNNILYCRAEEGTSWENFYGLWDGTTLTRVMVSSSSGSSISFTSAAVVMCAPDPDEVQPHIGGGYWWMWNALQGTAGMVTIGAPAITAYVATAAGAISTTNYLTRQARVTSTSVTTASAVAGIRTTGTTVYPATSTAYIGGFEMTARGGYSQLPTNPRCMVGMVAGGAISSAEPSAVANTVCFAKDSTDTNWQFLTNDGTASGVKTDTGIPVTANGFYEFTVWMNPGSATAYGAIFRLDSAAAWVGSATSNLPVANTTMAPQFFGGLSATTGTAIICDIQKIYVRSSF